MRRPTLSSLGSVGRSVAAANRFHFFGALAIVLLAAHVMGNQIGDRGAFASADLHGDVMDRWGAPIVQPAPSVRYVESGAVFNALEPLPLASQRVRLAAEMSYRKRGLVYFSGFEFDFTGAYAIRNPVPHPIDVAFVFPVSLERNKVLLSDFRFLVNGEPAEIPLAETSDKLVWTGRLAPEETARFEIAFRGRGLDSFLYALDPALPVRDFAFDAVVTGGDNHDYPEGVVPADRVETQDDRVALHWSHPSLESGVPVGLILPSEKSFDQLLVTMIRRAWAFFLFFFAGVSALAVHGRVALARHESYLVAAGYGFFFVLLPYLAAYANFYVAWAATALVIGGLLLLYLRRILPDAPRGAVAALIAALLWIPSAAVVLQGYTGLIYAALILVGLTAMMLLTSRPAFRAVLDEVEGWLRESNPTPSATEPPVDAGEAR